MQDCTVLHFGNVYPMKHQYHTRSRPRTAVSCAMSILVFCLLSLNTHASDQYSIGDTLYLWSKRGFKLREEPSLNARVLAVLPPGARVVIQGTSDTPQHITAFHNVEEVDPPHSGNAPKILYGNWVLIQSDEGQTGYVIDQYLLDLKPVDYKGYVPYGLRLEMINCDTIGSIDSIYYQIVEIHTQYSDGIDLTVYLNEKGSDAVYFFPGKSIEEVLIIFKYSRAAMDHAHVSRNWVNELWFRVELCEFVFVQTSTGVKVTVGCYC